MKKSIIITGKPATGKTYIPKTILQFLKPKEICFVDFSFLDSGASSSNFLKKRVVIIEGCYSFELISMLNLNFTKLYPDTLFIYSTQVAYKHSDIDLEKFDLIKF